MRRLTLGLLLVAAPVIGIAQTGNAQQTPTTFDRTQRPPVPQAKPLTFPTVQMRKLSNGIPVAVMEDHHSPVVSVVAIMDVSSSLDPANETGLQSIVTPMLSEGTTKHSADQLADEFAALGNRVSPLGFYTITRNVDKSIDLMAEQLLTPAFPQASLDRIKANRIAQLKRSQENPSYLASRVFADVLYGKDHPYARSPKTESINAITRQDVVSFYQTYFRPPNVTFVVAGDITPAQAVEKLNRVFGSWTKGKPGRVVPSAPAGVDSTRIYLYDRPNSPQSVILVGELGPRHDTPDLYAIELMNTTLGGAFTSRLNLNLREQHQYTYGAGSRFSFRRPPEVGTFYASTAVVTPKTDSAVIEIMKEIKGIGGEHPITGDEFAFAKASATSSLPLQFETISARARAVADLISDALPLDYYNKLIQNFNAVTLPQAEAAAKRYINPSKLAIVIVGDRKVIEPALKATGVAPVVVVDSL
jgi:predicted Zn-dependent peptidase